ncbi:NmrA family NAD(P)-binding protein [Rheinheimera muenzenbergensis]|uniref:NmrA family NAD(P)-binding protein n=1 Tax=Rheinheimera muenzenbergensis TaxID=1193628 RepID=A0ABU8C1G3_9GAMM
MLIVLGATGNIGREVAKLMIDNAEQAVFLSRQPQKLQPQLNGHLVRAADLDEPASLERAMAGGTKLLLVSPNSAAMQRQQSNAIQAALNSGIQHIVKISGTPKSVRQDSVSAVGRAHWHIEQQLKAQAPAYSILQCNFFMQNLLGLQAGMVRKSGKITLPFAADTVFRFINTADIAACAVRLLTDDKVQSQTYNLSGQASSFQQLADELSRLLASRVNYKQIPLWLTQLVMRFKGMPKTQVQHQLEMTRLYQQGISDDASDAVQLLTGRPAISLPQFLEQHLAEFKQQ